MTRTSLRRGIAAGVICTLAVALLSIRNENYFGAEWLLRDWMSARLAASRAPDPRIVVVAISEEAVRNLSELYGRPQTYSRSVYALAIDELRHAGASVIVLDLLFAEENPNDPAGDRDLAVALRDAPAILGVETSPAPRPSGISAPYLDKLWTVETPHALPPFKATLPHPMFAAVRGIGTMRLASSNASATIHDYVLADRTGDRFIPSLAVEAAREFLHAGRSAEVAGHKFRFGPRSVAASNALTTTIRWNGAKRSASDLSYTSVGFDKVILAALARNDPTAGLPPEKLAEFERRLRGRIALIGLTATGLDMRSTPLSPTAAGVEIHANAIDNLINGDFNHVANRWLIFPLIMLVAAAFGALIDATRSQLLDGAITIGVLALVLGVCYGAMAAGWVLPAFASVVSIILTYIAITVLSFIAEQHQTAVLRTTFGRYVSPQILDHILAHPEKVQLGGERRDLTILFSDIRGFTSISEAAEPEDVVEMLNEYLTRMVEILLAHGGTLDKFIGDAVMGFWNAPAPDPDHPRHAVACAIEMIDETARIRARWQEAGKPALRIGVGINTGEAVVGNIGAEKVFGYTVIGDAVNLASRLESKNKDYGTEIIISEFTRSRIAEAFPTVYLDEVKVKGKEKAVKIYEVRPHA